MISELIRSCTWFTLIVLFSGVAVGQDEPVLPGTGMGCRPPTAEEQQWQDENMIVAQEVKPNAIALERINQERQAQGLAPIDTTHAAKLGEEVTGATASQIDNAPYAFAPSVSASAGSLPVYVDNSLSNTFPPIGNQGSIGSCAFYSTVYYTMTNNTALVRGWNTKTDTSNIYKFSPKFVYNMQNGGADAGGWPTSSYAQLQKTGAPTLSEYPYSTTDYKSWCTNGTTWRNALNYRMDQSGTISGMDTAGGLEAAKAMLANGYVITYATHIYSWVYKTSGNDASTTDDTPWVGKNVCYYVNSGATSGHAMTIVGYNDAVWVDINSNGVIDAGEKGVFKIANSWGTGYGDGGFYYITYDALKGTSAVSGWTPPSRQMGFWFGQTYWITARPAYTPRLVGQFTLNQALRNQMYIRLGLSSTSTTTPTSSFSPSSTLLYSGGAWAFDGSSTAINGIFVIDYTDLNPAIGTTQRYYLTTQDGTSGSATTVSDFRLIDVLHGGTVTVATTVPATADASTLYTYVDYGVPAGNTAPTISTIPNTYIATNGSSALNFTVGDATTAAGSLIVSAVSSNSSLVGFTDFSFGGSGANRTLTISPKYNQSGSANITVTVSDGELTSNCIFALSVSVNTAPTITAIANRSINQDTATTAIAFTVGDTETAVASLTVSGTSSNTVLIPNANIVFGGSGASRTVTVTPATGQVGTSTITVTVSDSALTASSAFVLTVVANTTPTISAIDNQSTNQNTATTAIAFTVGDTETAAASLTVSGTSSNTALVPNANIVFGGSGANRTVTVTPATGQVGTSTITVTGSDSALTASSTFLLTVISTNIAPVANGQMVGGFKNSGIPIILTATDADADILTYTVTAPSHGTLSGTAPNLVYTPTANYVGSDSFTFVANDGHVDSNVALVSITLSGQVPLLLSAVSATFNPTLVGVSVAFVAAATDPDGDALTYAWNFGDGATGVGAGSESHTYAAAGTYVVSVTATDVNGLTVNGLISVVVVAGGGSDGSGGSGDGSGGSGGGVDTDGDGVSDENEIIDGTDPLDPNSMKKIAMSLSALSGKMSFSSTGKDACGFIGIIPNLPAKFNPKGAVLIVNVGGAIVSYTLDAKGKASNANGVALLSLKPSTRNAKTKAVEFLGGNGILKILMKNGNWVSAWADEGVDPTVTVKDASVSVTIDVTLNGCVYTATTTALASTKANVGGKFKK